MFSQLSNGSTMIDDRALRMYLRNNAAWNLDESAPGPPMIDPLSLSSSGHGDRFLNSSVNFPAEMRSANLNEMVSSIIDENCEYHSNAFYSSLPPAAPTSMMMQHGPPMQYVSARKKMPPMKVGSSTLSESGHPRNLPDAFSIYPHPPKDIQVLVRKGDHNGLNSLVTQMPLQQFRQMLGLQTNGQILFDRRSIITSQQQQQQRSSTSENRRMAFPSSSSSSSSSSSVPSNNLRLITSNNKKWSNEMPISPHEFPSDPNLISPMTTCQDISYYRSNRRTGVANTLHIAIEKCYEQLNYIRDSYAETESKIGVQIVHPCSSPSSNVDLINTNVSTLNNNPSRVDRLIAEYHHEYNRIIRLHERVKEILTIHDTESTRQTLDEWLSAINLVHERRRQEIDNAAEKCRSGEPRLPDEKDVLQLAEALRVLRITTRKIRTVLWYWLYWSTNATSHRIPLIARHQDETSSIDLPTDPNLFINSNQDNGHLMIYPFESTVDEHQGQIYSLAKKKILSSNENNKENECHE